MSPLSGEVNVLLTMVGPGDRSDDPHERDLAAGMPRRDSSPPVMIVEDDRDILETLTEILECEGHCVIPVYSAEEALQRLQAGPTPGLILLDLLLPGVSGWGSRVSFNEIPPWPQFQSWLSRAPQRSNVRRDHSGWLIAWSGRCRGSGFLSFWTAIAADGGGILC